MHYYRWASMGKSSLTLVYKLRYTAKWHELEGNGRSFIWKKVLHSRIRYFTKNVFLFNFYKASIIYCFQLVDHMNLYVTCVTCSDEATQNFNATLQFWFGLTSLITLFLVAWRQQFFENALYTTCPLPKVHTKLATSWWNIIEHLAAKESDKSLSSLWRPKT